METSEQLGGTRPEKSETISVDRAHLERLYKLYVDAMSKITDRDWNRRNAKDFKIPSAISDEETQTLHNFEYEFQKLLE